MHQERDLAMQDYLGKIAEYFRNPPVDYAGMVLMALIVMSIIFIAAREG